MRTYHPKSWSQSARELADRIAWNVEEGYCSMKSGREFFSNSYRHPLIRHRAAKRFGRRRRANKIHVAG